MANPSNLWCHTELRDYQLDMLERLRRAWRRARSVMVQMPTGTGKTHLLAAVIREAPSVAPRGGGGVLVVAHRRELIAQISETLAGFGIDHGLIVSGRPIDASKRVQVASIQTLHRHLSEDIGLDFGLVVIDEAHHALAKTYRALWEKWPRAKYLGLTATPCRLNRAPFTDLFQLLLQSWSIQEFIDNGWLSDFEYVSARPDSEALRRVRRLSKRGADGDYQAAEMALVMDVPESIAHLYKTYRQFAEGKRGIVYAIDRQHARHIADHYSSQGVVCCVIDGKTPAAERSRLVADYLAGAIRVLVSVDCFSEGFDCPEVEFIQLARPTLSLSKYLQQVGRGMRVSKGKPHVLILDQVGLYQTFGLPTEERDWRQMFYGQTTGKGTADGSRLVVVDGEGSERELVNLEMVRIKKGGRRHVGLEIFLKDGKYGVRNNGKVSCEARFKEIVRLTDVPGYFAKGIYGIQQFGNYYEMASLITSKGVDLHLRLFRDVYWQNGYFFSRYQPERWGENADYYRMYWDPQGNCYYDTDPEFQKVGGVEIAVSREHDVSRSRCYKFRVTTGRQSPRFFKRQLFFNDHILIARDYLVVKRDRNHAYHICGFAGDTIVVQDDGLTGYLRIGLDGRKIETMRHLPSNLRRITASSTLYYRQELKLQSPSRGTPAFFEY